VKATERDELPKSPDGELAAALDILARLAEVGVSLDVDADRVGAVPPAGLDVHPADGPPVELQERQLRLAATQYRVLIEQIPAVTFMASFTGDTNAIYVSPQIEALLGFTQHEWVSDPILWFKQTHPADRDWVSRNFAATVMSGRPFRGVIRVLTRGGETRWVQVEARFVRDERGQLLFLQGAGFDVTEQFRAQEAREQLVREQAARAEADRERRRLHELFRTLPAAIVVLRSADRVIEFLNPVAAELAGADSDVVGRPWAEVFPEFGDEAARALDEVDLSGEPCFLQEYRTGEGRWGDERYFNVVVQPLADPLGSVTRLLVHAVDVTGQVLARREVEQALRLRDESLSQLRETLAMREGFLSAVAHDLKTPIAAIQGRAQLLKRQVARLDTPSAARLVESAAAIVNSATRMTAMIEELLDLARLQAGGTLQLDCRRVDLVDLVRQAVADHRPQARRHHLRLETSAEPLVGTCDPVRLTRVLGNLLDNATKYSPEGGDVVVAIGRDPDAPADALLRVQDFGLGIAEADLPRIFERFHRGSNVVGRISGTGIGLSSAYQIVRAHGGTIDVASREGVGTTFTVRIPLGED
jgi:PAS domain S-box-containing protein